MVKRSLFGHALHITDSDMFMPLELLNKYLNFHPSQLS